MIIDGTHVLAGAPRERVFAALTDPALLARAVPGCKQLVHEGEDVFGLTLEAGAGSVRGTYSGHVRLGRREEPSLYEAVLDASGTAGSVQASLRAELADADGGTAVTYHMDAKVTGAIAGVGQRVLSGVSRKNASTFFKALEAELSVPPAPQAAAANGRAPGPQPEGGAGPAPRIYSGVRAVSASDDASVRWFVRGLLTGFLLSVISFMLGERKAQR